MRVYGYKTVALGGILAGSLIAAPAAFAHGGARYSTRDDTSQSYAWSGDTYSSSNTFSTYDNSFDEENPQFSNDSNPAPTSGSNQMAMDRLQRDREKLEQDRRSGASDQQIAGDERAIEMDQQRIQEGVAFTGEGGVVVTPGS
jgi:hypothetical protein